METGDDREGTSTGMRQKKSKEDGRECGHLPMAGEKRAGPVRLLLSSGGREPGQAWEQRDVTWDLDQSAPATIGKQWRWGRSGIKALQGKINEGSYQGRAGSGHRKGRTGEVLKGATSLGDGRTKLTEEGTAERWL